MKSFLQPARKIESIPMTLYVKFYRRPDCLRFYCVRQGLTWFDWFASLVFLTFRVDRSPARKATENLLLYFVECLRGRD